RPKGGTEGHEMPSVPQPIHLVSRRERLTPVSTPEENQALHVDPRSSRSPRQAEGIAHSRPHSHATRGWRAPLSVCSRDDPSGQHGGRCRKTRGGPCSAYPTAGVLHQRSVV